MALSGDKSTTDQRLGEVSGLIQGVKDQVANLERASDRRDDARQGEAQILRAAVATVQQEQIRASTETKSAIATIQHEQMRAATETKMQFSALVDQIKDLGSGIRTIHDIRDQVSQLSSKIDDLEELKKPVARHNRILAMAMGMSVLIVVLWTAFGDLLKSIIGVKAGFGH